MLLLRFILCGALAAGSFGALRGSETVPTITAHPDDLTVVAGEPATLSVSASGSAPLTYAWSRNGLPVDGATSASLVISITQVEQTGSYTVTVTNAAGSVTSNPARLTVHDSGFVARASFWTELEATTVNRSPAITAHDLTGGVYATLNAAAGRFVPSDVYGGLRFGNLSRHEEPSTRIDPGFRWDDRLGVPQHVAAQSDGKLLAAVYLSPADGATVVRVQPNGIRDATFTAPRFSRHIRFLSVQPDGKIILFTQTQVTAEASDTINSPSGTIYRLNADGQMDPTFTPASLAGTGTLLTAPKIDSSGRVYLVGIFTAINGIARPSFARLNADGTIDHSFPSSLPSGWSSSVMRGLDFQSDGSVVVSGRIFYSGVDSSSNPLLAVRFRAVGSFDSTFGQIFRSANAPTGTTGRGLVVLSDDRFVVSSTTLRLFSSEGVEDTAWPARNVYLAPILYSISRSPLTGDIFAPLSAVNPGGIAVFTEQGAAQSEAFGEIFGTTVTPSSAIEIGGGRVVIAGGFNRYGSLLAPGSVTVDSTGAVAVDPAVNGTPLSVASAQTSVFRWPDGSFGLARRMVQFAGNFDTSDDVIRFQADGSVDASWQPDLTGGGTWKFLPCADGSLLAWKNRPTDEELYLQGDRAWMRRYNPDGTEDTTFAPDLSSLYQLSLASAGDELFTVGSLSHVQVAGDGSLFLLATEITGAVTLSKLTADGSMDSNYPVVRLGDSYAVSGQLTTPFFDPQAGTFLQFPLVQYLAEQPPPAIDVRPTDMVYLAGAMSLGGQTRATARLLPDGSLDPLFPDLEVEYQNPLALPPLVTTLTRDHYGRIYLAGRFTSINGSPRVGLARLTPHGELDQTWNPSTEVRDPALKGTLLFAQDAWLHVLGQSASSADTAVTGHERIPLLPTAPVVTHHSPSRIVTLGQRLVLQADAFGGSDAIYQWTHNGVPIPGVDSTTLDLGVIEPAMLGTYVLTVTNAQGSDATAPIVLSIPSVAPTIVNQPSDLTVIAGQPASFTVTAEGTDPVSFQWNRNGDPIDGATNANFSLAAATVHDAGDYTVTVSNVAGSVTSNPATLTVIPAFEAWRAEHFTAQELTDLNLSGPQGIATPDGLPNLLKYALGLAPKVTTPTSRLPRMEVQETDWIYVYTLDSATHGVTVTVEHTTDLSSSTWTTLSTPPTKVESQGSLDTWEARLPRSTAPNRIFFRLRVTQ